LAKRHQRDGGISHLLAGPVRKVLEGLVVERKHLRNRYFLRPLVMAFVEVELGAKIFVANKPSKRVFSLT
jgi:hypothetical protein